MAPESTSHTSPVDPRTLSQLAGGLAHELKNPLSTIGLHLDIMREQWAELEEPTARRSLKTLDTLKQELGRLQDILEDFLLYARLDRLEVKEANLNDLLGSVADFVTPEARAQGVDIGFRPSPDLPALFVDARRLQQAILNLVINARHAFDGQGGQIEIITRLTPMHVVLEVVDDGPGMDTQTLAKCMEVYFSRKARGSGLGLPTVRRIAEAHGGVFELESKEGVGTQARILLPRTSQVEVAE